MKTSDLRTKTELAIGRFGSVQQSGVNRGGAEGLKGASGGRAEELAVFGRGVGIGRLGWIIGDPGDLELAGTRGDAGDLKLGRNSGDTVDLELGQTFCWAWARAPG